MLTCWSNTAYESERPASYNITRSIFLQLLGGVYLIAFASHFIQFEGLYGCDGILPVRQQMDMAQGLHWSLYPTLVRFHSALDLDVYWVCNLLSIVGLVLSALAAAGYGIAPIIGGCWLCYLSLTTVGDIFMLFQWDSLLLETGFLAILYAPLQQRPSRATQTSRVVMWMLRFLLFKLILMSGVVKITSQDRVWQELKALYYHFASQPLPTPVSWYLRQFHPLALQLGVAFTFIIEIPAAFLILCPLRVVRHWTAGMQALLQVLIMLTGNYGFFNLLTLVLIVNLLDDSCLEQLLRYNALHELKNRHGAGAAGILSPTRARAHARARSAVEMAVAAGYLLPAAEILLPAAFSLLATACYLLPTSCLLCLPPTADGTFPTTYCHLLNTTYCIPPATYSLLSTAYYLLPTTFSLPSATYQQLPAT